MLETIARSFEVDTATSKATCVDLMRANPFDVLVASERLSDGSGLELLSHVATRWPDTLRVLVIEPARLKLIRSKLGPFRLHATLKYPIDIDELETVLERMHQLLGEAAEAEEEEEEEPDEEPPTPPPATPVQVAAATRRGGPGDTLKVQKVQIPQIPVAYSSQTSRALPPTVATARKAGAGQTPPTARQASQAARERPSLGAPVKPVPPPVRRKLGNYTPLGAPEDEQLRIVEREFDQTMAPLAARAIRSREEASRPRTPKEKLETIASHVRKTLQRFLKR